MNSANKTVIAIVLAVIIVASSFGVLYVYDSHSGTSATGPAFNAQVILTGAVRNFSFSNSIEQSNVSVTIFSPSPKYDFNEMGSVVNLTVYNATSDPYEVILFNGTANATGHVHGHLNTGFWNVSQQWQDYSHSQSGFESMTIDATYYRVINNSLYAYSYINNIPYDPYGWNIAQMRIESSLAFAQNIYFNLSNPAYVLSLGNATNMSAYSPDHQIGGGGGGTCTPGTSTTLIGLSETTETGPMPMMMGSFDGTNGQQLNSALESASSTAEVNFTSGTFIGSSAQQTVTPSYGLVGPLISGSASAEMNSPVSLIYFSNVTMQVYRYEYETATIQLDCLGTKSYSPVYTQVEVIGTGGVSQLLSSSLDYLVNQSRAAIGEGPLILASGSVDGAILTLMNDTGSYSLLYSEPVQASYSETVASMTASDTVYSNAGSVYAQAVGVSSTIAAGLGTALTVMTLLAAANGADGDTTETGVVATALTIGSTVVGDADTMITDLSTFSFSVDVHEAITLGSYTNYPVSTGQPMLMNMYESTTSVQLTVDGTIYSIDFPIMFVHASLA